MEDTTGILLAHILETKSPFTSLQSGVYLKGSGDRCNLLVDLYLEAVFLVQKHSQPSNHSCGHDGSTIR